MSANIYLEKSFYGKQEGPAWHNLGIVSPEPITAKQALQNPLTFDGGFDVILRPTTILLNGVQQEFGGFGVVRAASSANPKEHVFDTCTARYKPLQPVDICDMFDKSVRQPIETIFFLGEGERMVLTWKLPSYTVKVGDMVELFGTVGIGFDTKYGANLFTASVRSVCANTFMAAEAWAEANTDGKGKGKIYSGKAVNTHLLDDLGAWMEHVQDNALREAALLQNFFGTLAETPIEDDDYAHFLLHESFPNKANVPEYFPNKLRDSKQATITLHNEKQAEIRDNVFHLFKGAGTAIDASFWGLFNAGTEFFNHYQPSKKAPYASIMFGGRADNMKKLALTLAKNVPLDE